MPNIHQRINELTELAKTYAEDGAFHTAAAKLRQLADEIDAHMRATDARYTKPAPEKPGERWWRGGKLREEIEEMAQPGTNPNVIGPSECDCGNFQTTCGYPHCASGIRDESSLNKVKARLFPQSHKRRSNH